MTHFNRNTNASYNFTAPEIEEDANKKVEVTFPTSGSATVAVEDGVGEVEINRQVVIVAVGKLEAALELNAILADHVQKGAMVLVVASCGATAYDITLADGFAEALVLKGKANTEKAWAFVYDGTELRSTQEIYVEHSQDVTVSGATTAVEINGDRNVINAGTLAADTTLNATIGAGVKVGSTLLVKAASGAAAKTITFGTGFSSPTMAGTIDKSKAMHFVFDGTNFVATAAAVALN